VRWFHVSAARAEAVSNALVGRSGRRRAVASDLQTFKARFFRALAHPVRIRILETLIRGDRAVQELQQTLRLDQPVVSQQLAVLRNQGIVTSKKEGLSVRYALRDPAIGELLDVARRIFNNHLVDTQGMLRELQREGRRGDAARTVARPPG
jgi:ArsR family transcriptional regulator